MPNKLLIQKDTLDDPAALADCHVGDTKTFTVTVTVTRDDPKIFEADVTDIEYGSDSDSQSEEAPSPKGPAQSAPTGKAPASLPSSY